MSAAMIDVRTAAHMLGGEVNGRDSVLCPGPGHSRHDRSLSVRFQSTAPEGFTVNSFAGDDFADCRDHVKAILGIEREAVPLPVRPATPARRTDNAAYASTVWQGAVPIEATPAADYLVSRGLDRATCEAVDALRFTHRCPFKGDIVPAMIGAMVNADTNAFQGIHRTRLDPKDKAMLGPAGGAVVKLSPNDEVTTGLAICEGIETGLALMSQGIAPIWACLSAGGIAAFPVLSGIESLTIYADNDMNGTGQDAAIKCGRRWLAAGREVRAFTSPVTATDFLDWRVAV